MEESILSIVKKDGFNIREQESKTQLAKALLQGEQAPCPVIHRFGGGLYIREAYYPKNTLVVGQEHVTSHMNVLLSGSIAIVDGDGNPQTLTAPHMFVAPAGSKVGYTLENTVWQNIYVTNSTDVAYLESILFKSPDILIEHQKEKLALSFNEHHEDREDFFKVLEESAWSEEQVFNASAFEGDKIPFPDGVYCITTSKSPIAGTGIFASAVIQKDNIIAPMRINGNRTPAGYLTNHSKNPNATVVKNTVGNLYLVALRDIHGMIGGDVGEEITIDYRNAMKINGLWKGI